VQWNGPDGYFASDDVSLIDVAWVHEWLANRAYWALGRSYDTVAASIAGSLSIGLYSAETSQVGFARFVTDGATFAWLCDVFVDSDHEGRGLGSFMVESALEHPSLAGVRVVLATAPERTLYRRFGFLPLARPERWMERGPDEDAPTNARAPT
jgi:GNAT superfamily N-acetyltransferase